MSLIITIPQTIITYSDEQKEKWKNGERSKCKEPISEQTSSVAGRDLRSRDRPKAFGKESILHQYCLWLIDRILTEF